MGTRFKKARFYVDCCPRSLIERIYYKMKDVDKVYFNAAHFKERVSTRDIPEFVLQKMVNFTIEEWKLTTCEVRIDTGKFVNSTWEIIYKDENYWLTIGYGNVAETIVKKTSSGTGKIVDDIESDIYRFVEDVNKKLMDKDKNMSMIVCPNCGKEISDKASKCVHCGITIKNNEEINKFVECDAEATECPNCRCPVEKRFNLNDSGKIHNG